MSHIYYNVDEILDTDRIRVQRRLQGDAVAVVRGSTANAPEDGHVLHSDRDPAYLDGLMRWLDPLVERVTAGHDLQRHGISLLEVARYRLLFALAPWEHRLWALQTMHRRWEPRAVLWVDQPQRRQELVTLRSLLRAARGSGIPAHYVGRPPSMPLWRDLALDSGVKGLMWWRREAPPPVTPVQPADCVFAEYFPNSAKVLVPVSAAMAQSGVAVSWLAGRPLVSRALAEQGIASILLEAATLPASRSSGLTRSERQAARRLVAGMPEDWLAGSIEMPAIRWPGLRRVVTARMLPLLSEAARFVEAYRDVFSRMQPRLVVSTTYTSIPGRAAALAAQAMGATAVFIQHGVINDNAFYYHFCQSHMMVWGEYERTCLIRAGHQPDHVHAVGSTIYDAFIQQPRQLKAKPFPQPGEPMKVGYLASRTGGSAFGQPAARAALQAIAESVRKVPGARLIVKPHPADSTRVPEDVLRAFPESEVVRNATSQDVILRSDVVIIISSTAGFEACLADRPLVIFNPTGIRGLIDLQKSGAAVLAEQPDELLNALRQVQHDPSFREALARGRRLLIAERLSGGRGDATEQVTDVLTGLLGDRSPSPDAAAALA